MGTHASDQELMDVLEGGGAGRTVSHMETCVRCRARLDEAREGWTLAREADVPEPSPLYWENFRRQVGRRIEGEQPGPGRVWGWRLVPAVAVAALIVGFVTLLPTSVWKGPNGRGTPEAVLPAWSALPADDDAGLSVIQALAATPEDLSAVAGCQGVDCLADLSDDETRALAEALRGELQGGRL